MADADFLNESQISSFMNVLVTGGAGFIGSHLCDALLADGNKVYVLDNLSTGSLTNLPKGVTLFEHSLGDDLTPLFSKVKFDAVFHLAAQTEVTKSIADPKFDAQINIMGTLNLLEHMRAAGVKRIIFSSTGGAIYGETDRIPTPETSPAIPESPYGIAKLTLDNYLQFYQNVHGFSTCSLRYSNVYGPRQLPKGEAGVVAIFIQSLLQGKQCTIRGDGKQTRDLVYVHDVVNANLVALHKKLEGIFNVGTGKQTTVNELHEKITKLMGFPWKAVHTPAVKGELMHSALLTDKIKPFWRAQTELDAGLRETIDWFKSHNK